MSVAGAYYQVPRTHESEEPQRTSTNIQHADHETKERPAVQDLWYALTAGMLDLQVSLLSFIFRPRLLQSVLMTDMRLPESEE